MPDILAEIDDTLADWHGSADSARWQPQPPFPSLLPHEMALARRLSAETGIDGYAAAQVVHDVGWNGGHLSPFWDLVSPVARRMREETARPVVSITVDTREFTAALAELGIALSQTLTRAFGAAANPGPLCINGREYARRRKARARRRRGR